MCEALRNLMKDEIYEENLEKDKRIAINLYESGVKEDVIAKALGRTVEVVMKWLGLQLA